MVKTCSAIVSACAFLTFASFATAQTTSTTTTTTWNPVDGQELTQSWTTNHYTTMTEPNFVPTVGTPLPPSVTLYPVPETINIPDRDEYSYSVINNRPVVVERTTRRVVHTWN